MALHFPSHHPHTPGPKFIALALVAVPAAILFFVAFAEMAGGEPSGAQHIPEALALVAIMAFAWRHPRPAGWLLVGVTAALVAAWLALIVTQARPGLAELPMWFAAGAVLFALPLLAGWLLLRGR